MMGLLKLTKQVRSVMTDGGVQSSDDGTNDDGSDDDTDYTS